MTDRRSWLQSRLRWAGALALWPLVACAASPVAGPEASASAALPQPGDVPPLPLLRLPPSALPAEGLALSQRLTVLGLGEPARAPQVVDVQLELDRDSLRLAGFAAGQRVLLMRWDGQDLTVQRHPRLPKEVDEARMLRDMTLVFWPAAAVQAALPSPWRWRAQGEGATLSYGHQPCITVTLRGTLEADSRIELTNLREHYRLIIESRPLEGSP